jgi:hypothetical protein
VSICPQFFVSVSAHYKITRFSLNTLCCNLLFIRKFLAGQAPTIFGDGEQSRDFTFVENVVQANLLACKAEGISGEVCVVARLCSITCVTGCTTAGTFIWYRISEWVNK